MSEELLPLKGTNYKNLISYQKAEVIYRLTYYFCHKYFERGDRTIDQMVQAARSGNKILLRVALHRLLPQKQKLNCSM